MRLVDGVKYRMEGNFSKRAYQPFRVFFQGQVIADRFGNLSGVIVDQHGPSTFKGHLIADIRGDHLEFSKEYDREHNLYRDGSNRPVEYELSLSLSGGWSGKWRIVPGEESEQGEVTMAIIPWDEGFHTISRDLVDYLTFLEAVKSS